MADGGDTVFVYLGGEQEVPRNVTHVVIDRSVKIIPQDAFYEREQLVSVKTHDGIEIIEAGAFYRCRSLRGIKLPGVKEVGYLAFNNCTALTDVEFGDKLETIRGSAFVGCSLQKIKIPTVRTIEQGAFADCKQLTDVELPDIEIIGQHAFNRCPRLQRIAIPLKDSMFHLATIHRRCTQFDYCENLTTVYLVGVEEIHKTISSLLLESWRDEMNQVIDRINQVLPNTPVDEKADRIRLWIISAINRMEHYKAEHNRLLKQDMTQLELAVWKAKIDEEERGVDERSAKKAKIDVDTIRKEQRITSGADIIIKNVLPFLQLSL
jgi:hypothetical protein